MLGSFRFCSGDRSAFSGVPAPDCVAAAKTVPPSFADYSKGFGGKFGIDKDKVDRSAVGFEYRGKTEKHESQKGDSRGVCC